MSARPLFEALRVDLSLCDEPARVIAQARTRIRPPLREPHWVPVVLHALGVRAPGSGSRSGRAPRAKEAQMRQQILDTIVEQVERGEQPLSYEVLGGRGGQEADRLVDGFVPMLSRMTPQERISASRYGGFTRWERWVWAARFPDEVPLVNGEYEWIARGLVDLD